MKEQHKKIKAHRDIENQLHVRFEGFQKCIKNLLVEINYAYQENTKQNQQFYYENMLLEKISKYLTNFTSQNYENLKSIQNMYNDSNYLYGEIIRSNEAAKKSLDNFLNKFEKENQQSFQEDRKALESSYSKVIMDEYDKRFMPQETEASEDRFWEKLEQYKQKNKKQTHVSGLTTNRDYTTQTSLVSMNTEATDDMFVEGLDDSKQSSIAKSLMSQKDFGVQNQQAQNQSYVESTIFKDSPHYPNIQKNPMMQFLVPEISEFCKKNQKSSKQGLQADNVHKMKFGNESKRDIEKALKKKSSKQNQNTINELDEDNYDEDGGTEDMEDEEEEQESSDYEGNQDQNNAYTMYSNKNNELKPDTMQYVEAASQKLVEISDKDIDFDQYKTKGIQLKKADEVAYQGNRYKTQSNADPKFQNPNSNSEIYQENVQNPENNTMENDGLDEDNDELDPFETPQNNHFSEQAIECKDDDIFDYSYEKDEDEDDDTDNNNSQQDNDSDNEENDSSDTTRQENSAEKKIKLKVPFTQFKSQIENSFIQFLKESLYTQDNELDLHFQENIQSSYSAQNQQKKKIKVSLRTIFPDIRVVNINGGSFTPHFNECYWMYTRKGIQNKLLRKRVQKINTYFFNVLGIAKTGDTKTQKDPEKDENLIVAPPILNRKKLNACEQKQINY